MNAYGQSYNSVRPLHVERCVLNFAIRVWTCFPCAAVIIFFFKPVLSLGPHFRDGPSIKTSGQWKARRWSRERLGFAFKSCVLRYRRYFVWETRYVRVTSNGALVFMFANSDEISILEYFVRSKHCDYFVIRFHYFPRCRSSLRNCLGPSCRR